MKKLLFVVTLCSFGMSLEASLRGRTRGFDFDSDDLYSGGYGGYDRDALAGFTQSKELQELSRYRNQLQQAVTKVEEEMLKMRVKELYPAEWKINVLEGELTKRKQELDKVTEKIDVLSGQQKAKSIPDSAVFGIGRALLGKGASVNDSLSNTLVQAITYNMFRPMGKVITRRSESMWEKIVDKTESFVTAIMRFVGLTSTISARDIIRWQTSCAALADAYKDLRKGIESSESRSTSLQLRSIMSDDDEDADAEVAAEVVIDQAWEQKRCGDVIRLNAMLAKLEIKRMECDEDDVDILAALDCLASEVAGLRDQIMSANNLRDLVESDRANLMTGYFASIDSALIELGMLIAPEEYDETKRAVKSRLDTVDMVVGTVAMAITKKNMLWVAALLMAATLSAEPQEAQRQLSVRRISPARIDRLAVKYTHYLEEQQTKQIGKCAVGIAAVGALITGAYVFAGSQEDLTRTADLDEAKKRRLDALLARSDGWGFVRYALVKNVCAATLVAILMQGVRSAWDVAVTCFESNTATQCADSILRKLAYTTDHYCNTLTALKSETAEVCGVAVLASYNAFIAALEHALAWQRLELSTDEQGLIFGALKALVQPLSIYAERLDALAQGGWNEVELRKCVTLTASLLGPWARVRAAEQDYE